MQHAIDPRPTLHYWLWLAAGCVVTALGLGAAHFMESRGHVVTGMTNQVVWGLPHVFAIFMIVAASGVLNVASVASVFGQTAYKPWARLSALLCITLLAGGLMVLMLDLGRPDRVIVAATHYNFKSVFAWNVFLYSGMVGIALVYLWTMFERRMSAWSRPAGVAVLVWRLVLTTGTGSIFAFLVARQAYGSALLAPLFIVMSFTWGLAVFLVAQAAVLAWRGRRAPPEAQRRMARLLGVFVAAALAFVAVHHLTSLYFARQHAFEGFVLVDGGVFPWLFWGGYVLAGSVAPLVLLLRTDAPGARATLLAALLVVLGAFAWLFAFIVGGQAFPLDIFPGYAASSSFGDGAIASYTPTLPEWLLGAGGLGAAFVLTAAGVHVLDFVPAEEAAQGAP